MPEEPKQPIETLLEAHARRRRAEGGDFELHEATRRLLTAEALRVHGRAAASPASMSSRSAWSLLWTRLAGAFGVIALMGVAVLVLHQTTPKRPSKAELELAKLSLPDMEKAEVTAVPAENLLRFARSAESVPTPESAASTAVSAEGGAALALMDTAPVLAESSSATALSRAATKDETVAQPPLGATSVPPPAAAPARVQQPSRQTAIAAAVEAKQKVAAPITNGPVVAGSARDAAAGALGSEKRFRRVVAKDGLRRNFQSPALPDVLKNFTVSRMGNRLRVVDQDGSVYLGDLDTARQTLMLTGLHRPSGQTLRFSGTIGLLPAGARAESGGDIGFLEGSVSLGERQQWRFRAEPQR